VSDRTINLTFHGIGATERRLEPGEADVWVSRDQFVSILDSVKGRDDVRITFDDGNASDLEHALPALRERGLKGTFFVVAGRLGEDHFLDAAGVKELAAAGMEIGCHGMRHRPWRRLGEAELREELVEAKTRLEHVLERPITRAACPFGSYDRRVLRVVREAGYEQVFTSDRGSARHDAFLQARTSVGPSDDTSLLGSIEALENPSYKALPRRAKLAVKRWR
jgi:peptidoglycan/xylan/chitin deacetylase (PgdA/CDA1 family)